MTGLGGRGTAVVTGASSGIGGEFARQLARRVDAVVIVARRRYRLEKLAAELTETGAAVEVLVADLTRSYDVGRVAECGRPVRRHRARQLCRHQRLRAVPRRGTLGHRGRHRAERHGTDPALPGRDHGHGRPQHRAIINVSSLLGFSGGPAPDPLPARATYVGTEAYVVALPRTLAAEPEASGINLQVLCPGRTATEFHAQQGSAPVSRRRRPHPPGRDERGGRRTGVAHRH